MLFWSGVISHSVWMELAELEGCSSPNFLHGAGGYKSCADFQGLVRRRLAPKPSHSERWDVCIPWAETWDTCWLPSQWKVQPDELWCDIPSRENKMNYNNHNFSHGCWLQFHSISMWPCWETRLRSTLQFSHVRQSNALGVKWRNCSAPVAWYFCKTAFTSASSPSWSGQCPAAQDSWGQNTFFFVMAGAFLWKLMDGSAVVIDSSPIEVLWSDDGVGLRLGPVTEQGAESTLQILCALVGNHQDLETGGCPLNHYYGREIEGKQHKSRNVPGKKLM